MIDIRSAQYMALGNRKPSLKYKKINGWFPDQICLYIWSGINQAIDIDVCLSLSTDQHKLVDTLLNGDLASHLAFLCRI